MIIKSALQARQKLSCTWGYIICKALQTRSWLELEKGNKKDHAVQNGRNSPSYDIACCTGNGTACLVTLHWASEQKFTAGVQGLCHLNQSWNIVTSLYVFSLLLVSG